MSVDSNTDSQTTQKKLMPTHWDDMLNDDKGLGKLTKQEIVEFYNRCAKDGSYERSVEEHGFGALDVLETTIKTLYPKHKDAIDILDVGACTGFTGQRLSQMGFRAIDALDPSYDSLELAKQKGVYRNLFNVAITGEELGIPQDSYDAVVLVGVAGPKHLPLEAFNEMIRLVKPGGYIVNLMRADFLDRCPEYAGQWEPMVQEHVKKGDWRLVERKRYPCHFHDREGFMEVFRVC